MFEYGLIIGDKTGVILDFGGIMFMIMLGLICAVIGYWWYQFRYTYFKNSLPR